MESIVALREMCLNCEKEKGTRLQRCPFRSISNDYCEEYEAIEKELKKPQVLYNKIKQKRDNAKIDYEKERGNTLTLKRLQGEIEAYNDVLSLMESMFEVENDTI